MKSFIYFSTFTLGFFASLYAQDTATRNSQLSDLNNDRSEFYLRLGKVWAPEFYADQKEIDFNGQKALAPEDAIKSPTYDGDNDWTNNLANLDVQKPMKAQVPFSVLETKSHYFIRYDVYHANDTGPGQHAQDMEHVWTVVEKSDTDEFGKLLFVATNAHGYAKIYSPDQALEDKLRETFKGKLSGMAKVISENTLMKDQFSSVHHKNGRPEFVQDADGNDRGLKTFVCRSGHALYKCNTDSWKNGAGQGTIYYCVDNGQEGTTQCFPILPKDERLVGYSLMNLDALIIKYYPRNETELPEAERQTLQTERAAIFAGQRHDVSLGVTDGTIRLRAHLPGNLAKAPTDKKPEAQPGHAWGFKTNYSLAIPHAVLKEMMPAEYAPKISDEYIFNPHIEYTEVKPAEPKQGAMLDTPSSKLCLMTPGKSVSEDLSILRAVMK